MTPPHKDKASSTSSATTDAPPFPMNLWYRAVTAATDLRTGDLRILLHVATYATWGTGENAHPGMNLMSGALYDDGPQNKTNLRKALQRLVASGWLVQTAPPQGPGKAGVYRLTFGAFRPFDGAEKLALILAEREAAARKKQTPTEPEEGVQQTPTEPEEGVQQTPTEPEEGVQQTPNGVVDNPPKGVQQTRKGVQQTRKGVQQTRQGGAADHLSSSYLGEPRDDLSSGVASADHVTPGAPEGGTGEEENLSTDSVLALICATWPYRQGVTGEARHRGRLALEPLLKVVSCEVLLADLAKAVAAEEIKEPWLDLWLNAYAREARNRLREGKREERRRAIAECPLCDEEGWINAKAANGNPLAVRCDHKHSAPEQVA